MTTNKKPITWKKNKILSLKLRNGHFALLQLLERPKAIVFDYFSQNDAYSTPPKLKHENILFIANLTKDVLKRSELLTVKTVEPLIDVVQNNRFLSVNNGSRRLTLWEDTSEERTLIVLSSGKDNSICEYYREDGQLKTKYTKIKNSEYENYKHLELTSLSSYPSFNERLLLCEFYGTNFDPLRELAFNRPLDLRCKTYIDIISGQVELSKLGY